MEDRRQWFRNRLSDEVIKRYGRLCQQRGSAEVIPPSDGLIDAFVDAMEPTWSGGSDAAIAACVQAAGEGYEYVVGRWPDPRWRAVVEIALEAGVRRRQTVSRDVVSRASRPHRSASGYARELILGEAET